MEHHHMQSPLHGRKREMSTKREVVLRKVAIVSSQPMFQSNRKNKLGKKQPQQNARLTTSELQTV